MNPADLHALLHGNPDDREEHLYALVDRVRDTGDESATAALRAVVSHYRDFDRDLYCRALNEAALFGDATLEAPLLAALVDVDYDCQAWAARGCTALGFRAAVALLVPLLADPRWTVREEAVFGLGVLGDESVVADLVPLLAEREEWMRQRAADALSKIGGDAAAAALWDEFDNRRFPRIGYIASGLAHLAPGTLARLTDAAASDDPDKRYWAAVALGSTGDESAVPTLERLMADDTGVTVFDGEVRVAAKKGLRTLRRIQAAIAAREN